MTSRQILVVEADARLVAERALGIENETVAFFKQNFAVLEFANADFRALQVGQNTDGTLEAGSDLPHGIGQCDVVFCLAM